ncbi:potassium channel, subfamily k, member 1a [Plakobranchus ocellatus]|uniref:Potassium channel, subfamily k, member 1a n=1 Tax=Plakobranchus ocellatus TaxID=259542 RepID=A0AAV4BT30_9GAST|nr:potassium channel, subfamily k, member 1a [Plakobranchus ocellatus]
MAQDTEPITGGMPGDTTTTSLMRRSTFRLFALGIFYLLFLVIGASIFAAIEGPQEKKLVERIRNVRKQFFQDYNHCLPDIYVSPHGKKYCCDQVSHGIPQAVSTFVFYN